MVSAPSLSIVTPFSVSVELRFILRVCTVIHSASSARIPSTEFLKLSYVSVGKPAIRSVFIFVKPHFLARAKASKNCCTVCFLPISRRTSSFNVCGFMLILSTLFSFKAFNFSAVIVSGLPASTVNSLQADILKLPLQYRLPLKAVLPKE